MDMELRKRQLKEAVARMNMLNLLPETIHEFEASGVVNKSEYGGILYYLDEEEELQVKKFEEEYNALVYHAIKGSYKMRDGSVMQSLDFIYVSSDEEEWKMDREYLKDEYLFVYATSNFCPCGEFGSITFYPNAGGLVRTA